MNEAHAVLPIFLAQDRGTWVNMISVGGFLATPYAAAYSASKFGLRGFSEALRGDLSKKPHIHVCDVYPTFVDTPGIDHAVTRAQGCRCRRVLSPRKQSRGQSCVSPVDRAIRRLSAHPRSR
jgi:short-subunit dehydrogenase